MKAKEKILQEAAILFSKRGYAEAGTDEIILNAGISKGLLFYHYKSKEGLLDAVLERAWEIISHSCEVDTNEKNANRVFRQLIKNMIHSLKMDMDYWKVYSANLLNENLMNRLDLQLHQPSDAYQEEVHELFNKMGKKNPLRWAFFFDIQFRGVYFGYISDPKNFPLEKAKQVMIDMFTR